ncbi:hypothetical protein [Ferrimonas futtsuensis]|uniref:hypothetical protein n=1 Tax=Ferrimonas futtsuensis TaxID=364764 RepID=UPI000419796F|nr:hypothetical protein [Ferrimonas futtsuensis]
MISVQTSVRGHRAADAMPTGGQIQLGAVYPAQVFRTNGTAPKVIFATLTQPNFSRPGVISGAN